ncbi:wHTH domain-containing protein [Amycolatopsis sp. NPDC004772]
MAKHSRLVERLRALRELSGLTNVKIAERSKTYVVPGAAKRHPLNDRSIGDWLRGDHVPSEEGLRVLVGVMQVVAADRRPPIERPDPELMKGVAEGSWLDWLAEARERDGRRPAPPEDGSRWEGIIRAAKIWPDAEGAAELRDQALAALRQLEGERRKAVEAALADDPWLDEELPERTVRRVSELVGYLSGAPLEFSAVEAFLLTVAPLLYHTRWAQTAVEAQSRVDPMQLERHPDREGEPDFEFFLGGGQQQRLVERARHLPEKNPDRRAICWWLFHRWLDQSAAGQAPAVEQLSLGLESPQATSLEQQLKQILQVFRLSPGELKEWRSRDQAEEWPGGQRLRVRLVALVLGLAHTMAIEPGSLSSTLVEHLGIDHQVELAGLRRTLCGSSWVRTSTALRLDAECRHEAVYEVLTEHVTRMSEVLRTAREVAAHETAVAPLLPLPGRASDEDVRPARRADGRLEFVIPTTKFRLDETRVRELLMGEQLYRDRSLAIRELYQNALDACRYRQAWHQYLVARSGGPRNLPWPGKIRFRQWEESGQHFLSCHDNGVGMGEAELREVFSQAGIRFADRREFAVERARWKSEGVHIHPNSRFGIGVMSYFMLADRIEVTTRRLNLVGDPLPLVKVVIAGPGHLFRVDRLTGPDDDGRGPGTEVKLHLRDGASAPSCVATLRALLGIAEFETTAQYGEEETEYWHPFQFEPRRRHPAREDSIEAYGRLHRAAPSENGQVIWCEHGGALLVDGIYVRCENQHGVLTATESNTDPRGAVINLTGRYSPRLSVDRMSVLQDVSKEAEVLLNQAADELRHSGSLLKYQWTLDIAENNPGIADIVANVAITESMPTRIGQYGTTADVAGIMALDPELAHDTSLKRERWNFTTVEVPPHLLLWRLLALNSNHTESTTGQTLLPALPSDQSLIRLVHSTHSFDALEVEVVPPSVWRAAFHLGISPTKAMQRLAKLGFSVTKCEELPPPSEINSADMVLMESALKTADSPRRRHRIDLHAQVVIASAQLDMSMAQIAQRLDELGLDTPRIVPPGRADGTDVRLISNFRETPFEMGNACLRHGEPVSALYVLLAARATGLEPLEAANRLRRLGLDVPDFEVTMADLEALPSQLREAMEGAKEHGHQPRTKDICRDALRAGCQPGELARTLARFGVHLDKQPPEQLTATDEELIPSTSPLLSLLPASTLPDQIGPREFIQALLNVNLTPEEAVTRLEAMGFEVCEAARLMPAPDSVDRTVLQAISPHTSPSGRATTVDLREFAEAVTQSGYRSADVARRLARFGLTAESFPDVDGLDPQLIPPGLSAPTASGQIKVPLPLILKHAAEERVEPTQIGACLHCLGYSVPKIEELSSRDLALVCKDMVSLREMLDLSTPVTLSDLLRAAIRAEMPVREAAVRFTELGFHFEFPDLDDELQRLFPLVPRASKPEQ